MQDFLKILMLWCVWKVSGDDQTCFALHYRLRWISFVMVHYWSTKYAYLVKLGLGTPCNGHDQPHWSLSFASLGIIRRARWPTFGFKCRGRFHMRWSDRIRQTDIFSHVARVAAALHFHALMSLKSQRLGLNVNRIQNDPRMYSWIHDIFPKSQLADHTTTTQFQRGDIWLADADLNEREWKLYFPSPWSAMTSWQVLSSYCQDSPSFDRRLGRRHSNQRHPNKVALKWCSQHYEPFVK